MASLAILVLSFLASLCFVVVSIQPTKLNNGLAGDLKMDSPVVLHEQPAAASILCVPRSWPTTRSPAGVFSMAWSSPGAELRWPWLSKPLWGPILGWVNSPPIVVYFGGENLGVPFWGAPPIVVYFSGEKQNGVKTFGIGEFTTHFRTYFLVGIGMFTGGTGF